MITNGNSLNLNQITPALPNMSTTLEAWFQKIVIGLLTTTIVNNRAVSTTQDFETMGVLQPFSAEQLEIKKEGERSWKWYMLHCQPSLSLQTDDTVIVRTKRYRVMGRWGFDEYGFIQYELVQDYETIILPTT